MKNKTILVLVLLVLSLFALGISSATEPITNYDYWIGINRLIDIFVDTNYATGLDVSKHRGELTWNFEDERIVEIIDFVIIRAGYVGYESGEIVTDEQFEASYNFLEQHPNVLRGTYWYHSSHETWEKQYDYFVSIMQDKDFDFIALDFEEIYNDMNDDFGEATKDFLLALQKEYPNKKVFIYTHQHHYNDWLGKYPELASFPYWSADYPTEYWHHLHQWSMQNWITKRLNYKNPPVPKARMEDDWDIWQFGDKTGMGEILGMETLNVDINRSRLMYNDFVSFIGVPNRWNIEYTDTQIIKAFPEKRLETMHPELAQIYLEHETQEEGCSYLLIDRLYLCVDGFPCEITIEYNTMKNNNVAFIENNLYLRSDRLSTTYNQVVEERHSIDTLGVFVGEDASNIQMYQMEYEGIRFEDRYFVLYLEYPANVKSEVLICEVGGVDG